jgi:peptidoglycan/LPS O-acetylase OafA/YrhL
MNNMLQIFRRSTNSTGFIPEIDGLRFYAILTVVIFHLNTAYSKQLGYTDLGVSLLGNPKQIENISWWMIRLDLGVKVFFAISGFVLALPFLRHYLAGRPKVSIGDYFYRRLTRLEPPFVVSLLLFLSVHIWLLGASLSEMLPHMGAGLLYSHVLIYGVPNPINPVTWSLETEAQFYIIVPLLFTLLFLRQSKIWSYGVISLLFVISMYSKSYFVENSISQFGSSVISYLSNFLTGVIFAWLYLSKPPFLQKKSYYWDILGLIAVTAQFFYYKPQYLHHNVILFNAGVLLMMVATFKGKIFNSFFTMPAIFVTGGMCYSIYLLHYAFLHLLVKYSVHFQTGLGYLYDLMLQIIICLPIVLIISAIFFLAIEKPCMNKHWPERLIHRIRTFSKRNQVKF